MAFNSYSILFWEKAMSAIFSSACNFASSLSLGSSRRMESHWRYIEISYLLSVVAAVTCILLHIRNSIHTLNIYIKYFIVFIILFNSKIAFIQNLCKITKKYSYTSCLNVKLTFRLLFLFALFTI